MSDNNKERLRGLTCQRDRYNTIIDGKHRPPDMAIREMHRKPYSNEWLPEMETEVKNEDEDRPD